MAFGGDVHFPVGTNLGDRLAAEPADALGPTVPQLLSGVDLSMVNFESAVRRRDVPRRPAQAVRLLRAPFGDHRIQGCRRDAHHRGQQPRRGLRPAGAPDGARHRAQTGYTILGIGQTAAQAFTPYTTTIHGEHIAIIAATQVIDSDLQTAWTATATQPGLASAYDVSDLVAAVEAARKTADTVVVYLHWGTELDACPNPLQEPLAQVLVQAGADIVVGTHAHVLLGGGYLGSAYVDYGLGNFAFYDNSPPENASGSLVITATGRHIDQVTWRPAVIVDDLPQPLSGDAATAALAAWSGAGRARTCRRPRGRRSPRGDRDLARPGLGGAGALDRLRVGRRGAAHRRRAPRRPARQWPDDTDGGHQDDCRSTASRWPGQSGEQPGGTPTLVLCHGYTGSAHDFALQVDTLAAHRRVVTLDLRGHGHSAKTGMLEGYTMEQLADDLAECSSPCPSARRPPRPLHGGQGRHDHGARAPRAGLVVDPHGHQCVVVPARRRAVRSLVRDYIEAFDPSGGMPTSFNLGGPEDKLIAARCPPSGSRRRMASSPAWTPTPSRPSGWRCGPSYPRREPDRCAAG